MTKYNLDKLIKVDYYDFYPTKWITYKKEKKFLGFVTQKEGYYEKPFNEYLGLKEPENHTLKNGILYRNPEVILHYQNGHSKTYYFNSFDEVKKFVDEITTFGKWII